MTIGQIHSTNNKHCFVHEPKRSAQENCIQTARNKKPANVTVVIGVLLAFSGGLVGCATSSQLAHSSLAAGKTITDLQYEIVLNNLAMFTRTSNALPSQTQIVAGLIQVTDTAGVGTPNLSYAWSPWSWAAGFSASRKWQESWTVNPIVDLIYLDKLRNKYLEGNTAGWLHHGTKKPESACIAGNYGSMWVWVYDKDRAQLTDFTFDILDLLPQITKPSASTPSFQIQ